MKTFLGGILLALAMLGVPHARALLVAHLAMLALSVALFDPPYVLGATVAIVMVIAVTQVKALDRLASAPALVGLGLLSYCIYLFHMLVGGAVIEALQALISDEPGWLQPVFLACGLAATIVFSALVYRLVERPSIALSKRFAPARRLREATA